MPNILDLLRNPIQDGQGQPDYAATAVDLNAQSLPAPMSVGAPPTPSPTPQNAILSQPSASDTPPTAAQPPPTDTASLVKDAIAKKYGYSKASDDSALQDAMVLGNNNRLAANLGGALNTITNAISGRQHPADNSFYTNLANQSDDQVKNVLTLRKGERDTQAFKREQELQDPNGVKAAILRRQYAPIAQKVGIDPSTLNGLSVQDLKEFASQPLEFAAKLKAQDQQHQESLAMKKLLMQGQMDDKKTKREQKTFDDLSTHLESMRGNPAAQQAERDIYAADKISQLASKGNLSPQMVQLLASEVGKIATGGVPTTHELQGLVPNTLPSQLASLAQRVMNKPEGADAQEFIKQFQGYAQSIRGDAERTIADRYGRMIDLQKGGLSPEHQSILQEKYLNRFKKQAEQPAVDQSGVEAELRRRGLLK